MSLPFHVRKQSVWGRLLSASVACLFALQPSLLLATSSQRHSLAPESSFRAQPVELEKSYPIVPINSHYANKAVREVVEEIISIIKENNAENEYTTLGLFTGNTSRLFYREFVRRIKEEKLDLSHVVTFNLDEYEIQPSHRRSFRSFMDKVFFDHVDLPEENIHFLNAYDEEGKLLGEEALQRRMGLYEEAIDARGGMDLVLLGLGRKGQFAISERMDEVIHKTSKSVLAGETREANRDNFGGDIDRVPAHALTMGVEVIKRAKRIRVMAYGRNKQDAVQKMISEDVDQGGLAILFRGHRDFKVYVDNKSLPPNAGLLRRLYELVFGMTFFGLFVFNETRITSAKTVPGGLLSFSLVALTVTGFVATTAGWMLGSVAGLLFIGLLLRRQALQKVNPFLNIRPRETLDFIPPEVSKGEIEYRVVETREAAGDITIRYSMPTRPTDPHRPVIKYDHGHEPFELYVGVIAKTKHFITALATFAYDVRTVWSDPDKSGSNILRKWAEGHFLRAGKTVSDSSILVSDTYAKLERWPFSNLTKFKLFAQSALGVILESIRKQGRTMIAVSYSVGARLRFIHSIHEFVERGDEGEWKLKTDFDPKIRGLIPLNAFFHTSEEGSRWIRWQRGWFWDPLTKLASFLARAGLLKDYNPQENNAYDEMDPSFDFSKIHERAKLAAQHKDWPQVVWMSTRLTDERLRPPGPGEFWKHVRLKVPLVVYDVARTLVESISPQWAEDWFGPARKFPFYYWLASLYVDFRNSDGVVDPNLAVGLDHYGDPLDPNALAIIVRGLGHDSLDDPFVQKLYSQLAEAMADGEDLRRLQLHVKIKGERGPRIIALADAYSRSPLLLDVNTMIDVEVVKPTLVLPEPDIEPARQERALGEFVAEVAGDFPSVLFPQEHWHPRIARSLRILEDFKSAQVRKAWEVATESLNSLEPSRGDPLLAEELLEAIDEEDWISPNVVLAVWVAKGLLNVEGIPGARELAHLGKRTLRRSKTRWNDAEFSIPELVGFHSVDRILRGAARDLVHKIKRPADFTFTLYKLLETDAVWRELAETARARDFLRKREEDFVEWMILGEESRQYMFLWVRRGMKESQARALWDMSNIPYGDLGPDVLRGQYREVYRRLAEDRADKLLQLFLTFDLRIPVGEFPPPKLLQENQQQELEPTLVDAAL